MRARAKTVEQSSPARRVWAGTRRGDQPRPARSLAAVPDQPAARVLALVPDQPEPLPSRHRQGGGTQDWAVYSCRCGYVFDAAVSTSVGCPHCGDTQAW